MQRCAKDGVFGFGIFGVVVSMGASTEKNSVSVRVLHDVVRDSSHKKPINFVGMTIEEACRLRAKEFFALYSGFDQILVSCLSNGTTYGPFAVTKEVVIRVEGLRGAEVSDDPSKH